MNTTNLIKNLGRTDIKLFGRDRLPISMVGFIIYIVVVLRWGLPWLNDYLIEKAIMPGETISIPFSEYYPLVVGFLVFFTGALIIGMVYGFIFLDEKDQNTLKAMMVTPISINQYLSYRIWLTVVIGFVTIVFMVLFINQALIPMWQLLLISLGASIAAPIAMLFFAASAENKLQGFAYGKFVSIAGWTIILGWFVPEPWQWLFGLFPPFLISKSYWMAFDNQPGWWIILIIGSVLQIVLMRWMMKWFNKKAFQA